MTTTPAPRATRTLIVGTRRRISVRSSTRLPRIGTLRSARSSTVLPATSTVVIGGRPGFRRGGILMKAMPLGAEAPSGRSAISGVITSSHGAPAALDEFQDQRRQDQLHGEIQLVAGHHDGV